MIKTYQKDMIGLFQYKKKLKIFSKRADRPIHWPVYFSGIH